MKSAFRKTLACALCLSLLLGVMPTMAEDGGAYRQLYSGEITTLNYLTTATTNEFALSANVIDTLVEYDKYGQVQPSLAESWTTSEDGLVWTFTIRKGATWVNAKGEVVADVTANDFVAAAAYMLNAENASGTADVFYSVIAGAEAYYLGTTTPEEGEEAAPKTEFDTVGVKALDDYTLEYTLYKPVPYFLSMLTYVCFMPVYEPFLTEKGADFGLATAPDTILYNGAYYLSAFEPQQRRVLTKNAANWDAEHVYIESILYTYNKEASTISPEMYKRGEIDAASIDSTIAAEWLADPESAALIHPVRQSGFYSYFYAFNFDPKFDAAYEPENWKLAVNNENFRKSIYSGLDRVKAMICIEPDQPESIIFNSVTPPEFVSLNGVDYTEMGALAPIKALGLNTFDEAQALAYKEAAVAELTEAGATFPIKILMPYNPGVSTWSEECQVVKQQLEGLLGADYIEIIVEAGPSTGFLTATRRAGNYALMKCNWGPDYADPETYTDPFALGGTYNFPEYCVGYEEEDGTKTYNKLVDEAKAIFSDLEARYLAFAEAEAFYIEHAFVIPFGYGNGGYSASRLNPFESQFAPFGISNERYKGQYLLDAPLSTDEYFDAYDAWLEARAALAEG